MNKYRIPYDPELHDMHKKAWSEEDLMYLCSMYENTKGADLALSLGRTHATVMSKVYYLRKTGLFENYKQRGKEM
jgi:biotin operon repressor